MSPHVSATLLFSFWLSPVAMAVSSYNVPPNTDTTITEFSSCHTVRHTFPQNLFVPTNSAGEWSAFYTHPPAQAMVGGCAAPTPRVISTSYYSDWSGTTYKSPATMSRSNWEISTTGVADGDLLLVIAVIDNGSDTLWPNPIAPGFTQLYQKYYGNDGQTLQVSYKVANSEPASYSGGFVNPSVSYSSVITLLAISGTSGANAIRANNIAYATGSNKPSPITATSTGVTAPMPYCTVLFFSAVDWQEHVGTSSFTTPSGFTSLVQKADRGALVWDWTSLFVAYKKLTASGASGSVSSVETASSRSGIDLEGTLAICP